MDTNELLKQSIIDAKVLRESAMKTAEQAIIEKYTPQIEEAVSKMLEQDEESDEEFQVTGDPNAMVDFVGDEEGGLDDSVSDDVPLAGIEGEEGELGEEEEIEIDFAELEKQIQAEELDSEEMLDSEEVADEVVPEDDLSLSDEEVQEEEPLAEDYKEVEEAIFYDDDQQDMLFYSDKYKGGQPPAKPSKEKKEKMQKEVFVFQDEGGKMVSEKCKKDKLEEDEELNEEELEKLVEELIIDLDDGVAVGHMGSNRVEGQEKADVVLAQTQETPEEEQEEALKAELEALREDKKRLIKEKNTLIMEQRKLKNYLNVAKTKLAELTISNARLLYTNKVFENTSLNERQKEVIVEAISKTNTVEKAKVVFETLSNAVTSNKEIKKAQETLREVTSKANRSTLFLNQRQKVNEESDSVLNRMTALAGIKPKK